MGGGAAGTSVAAVGPHRAAEGTAERCFAIGAACHIRKVWPRMRRKEKENEKEAEKARVT